MCIFENILLLATHRQRQLPLLWLLLLLRCQRRRRHRRRRSRFWILCGAHFVKITFRFEFSKQKLVAGARREKKKIKRSTKEKKRRKKKNVLLLGYLFKQFAINLVERTQRYKKHSLRYMQIQL